MRPFDCDGATEKLFANRLCKGGVGDECVWWSDVINDEPTPPIFLLLPSPTALLAAFWSALRTEPMRWCVVVDVLDWLVVLIALSITIPCSHLNGWKIPN